jgi:hypothetical protein
MKYFTLLQHQSVYLKQLSYIISIPIKELRFLSNFSSNFLLKSTLPPKDCHYTGSVLFLDLSPLGHPAPIPGQGGGPSRLGSVSCITPELGKLGLLVRLRPPWRGRSTPPNPPSPLLDLPQIHLLFRLHPVENSPIVLLDLPQIR